MASYGRNPLGRVTWASARARIGNVEALLKTSNTTGTTIAKGIASLVAMHRVHMQTPLYRNVLSNRAPTFE